MCKERNVHMFGSSIRVHCNVPFTPALAKKFKVIVADASCDNGCLVSEVHAVDPTIQVKWTHPRTLVFLDGKNEVRSYTEGNNTGAEVG